MVAGVDDISAVAGIISCTITLLHGCIKGFELLCRARKCEQEMSRLQLMLEFEEQKLLMWAHEVGLTEESPKLRVAVQHAKLVQDTLEHLGALLCDVHKLKRYGLVAEQTSEIITHTGHNSALIRLDLAQKAELHDSFQTTAKIFQNRTSPWHKLKWVAVDGQRFRRLLGDISDFNDQLRFVLEHDRLQMLESRHNMLLRNAIMNTTDQQDLELLGQPNSPSSVNKSIAATAKLKGWSLRLGLFERFRPTRPASFGQLTEKPVPPVALRRSQTESSSDTEEMKLLRRHLRLPSPPKLGESRQLAYYNCKPILVEWRPVNSDAWRLLRPRVNNLASLLHNMDDSSFHSLSCRGYLRYENAGVYGYVFDLPGLSSPTESSVSSTSVETRQTSDLPILPSMRTLLEVLNMSIPVPSLNTRVACAINLLETILQLHTAGWLHKELRSENVLFLTYTSDQTWQASDISHDMYVGGYVYARADNPQEFTEPAKSEIRNELYRHSASLGTIRMPYKKSFDIFSVGCILLEFGLWTSLSHTLSNTVRSGPCCATSPAESGDHSEPSHELVRLDLENRTLDDHNDVNLMQAKRDLLENAGTGQGQSKQLVDLLEAQAGKTYANIVLECLTAARTNDNNCIGTKSNEQIDALNLEQRSLTRLRQLSEVL